MHWICWKGIKTANKIESLVWNELVFNSLWPSDAIWQYKSRSTLAQAMACCWWLFISKVLWDSPGSNFSVSVQAIIFKMSLKSILLKVLPHLLGANGLMSLHEFLSLMEQTGVSGDYLRLKDVASLWLNLMMITRLNPYNGELGWGVYPIKYRHRFYGFVLWLPYKFLMN